MWSRVSASTAPAAQSGNGPRPLGTCTVGLSRGSPLPRYEENDGFSRMNTGITHSAGTPHRVCIARNSRRCTKRFLAAAIASLDRVGLAAAKSAVYSGPSWSKVMGNWSRRHPSRYGFDDEGVLDDRQRHSADARIGIDRRGANHRIIDVDGGEGRAQVNCR